MFSAQKIYPDHRYIRFDPITLHGFSRCFRILHRKILSYMIQIRFISKYFLYQNYIIRAISPSLRYVVEGFFCIIWSSLEPYIIDLSRFYKKKNKNYKNIFLRILIFYKIAPNRSYKALNSSKWRKQIPLQHILTRGL